MPEVTTAPSENTRRVSERLSVEPSAAVSPGIATFPSVPLTSDLSGAVGGVVAAAVSCRDIVQRHWSRLALETVNQKQQ